MPVTDPIVLEKGLKTAFFKAYDAANPITPLVATEAPSTNTDEKYGWLGTAPAMREWIDERQPAGLLDHSYTITNKKFEGSISVDEDDLEDDNYGQINIRVSDLGGRARRHPDTLLKSMITDGETDLCYDGQAFFDTDHSEGSSGTQSNDLTASVTSTASVTVAEAKTIFYAQLEALLSFVDDRGEPYMEEWELNSNNLITMISPDHMQGFEELFGANLTGGGDDNILKNRSRLVINPRLTDTTKIYTFYTGGVVKPFIWQRRRGIRARVQGVASDRGFDTGEFVFGVDYRANMGYGLWQMACLTTIS